MKLFQGWRLGLFMKRKVNSWRHCVVAVPNIIWQPQQLLNTKIVILVGRIIILLELTVVCRWICEWRNGKRIEV